ncbi:MAG TPA: hypothetical protein VF974_03455 [Patescibacteria group bacterium]
MKYFEIRSKDAVHIIRHMVALSSEVLNKIHALGISNSEIAELMKTPGSKFNEKINDPWKLTDAIESLINHDALVWEKENGKLRAKQESLASNETKKALGLSEKDPLGYSYVVKITQELKDKVKQQIRGSSDIGDKVLINVIEGVEPKPIDTLVVHLVKENNSIFIESLYPGFDTPALPNESEQTVEEYSKNKEFWDNYAFIRGVY